MDDIKTLKLKNTALINQICDLGDITIDKRRRWSIEFDDYGISGVIDAIRANVRQQWIDVKEQLPDFDVPVLIYCSIYGRYISVYSRIGESDFGHWMDPDGLMGALPPTHWTLLPEPPGESE